MLCHPQGVDLVFSGMEPTSPGRFPAEHMSFTEMFTEV